MRKIAVVFLLLSLPLILIQVLQAQSRPRRVGQTTSAPPVTSQPSQPTRPPVLGGATNAGQQPSTRQTAPPASNEPVEVGEGDVVRVSTTLVTVPVSVMDRDGKYVPDLRKEDFRIYEDGVEQRIAYFASVEKPFTVVLMLDVSGSTRYKLEDIQDAAIAFVNQLRPDDRVLVVSFEDQIKVLAEATSDRSTLRNAIRRSRTGDGTRLYDAVDFVIKQRLNSISGRKAIVLFTDGVDTTSRHATYQSTVREAEELDALIYPVQFDTYEDVRGGNSSPWPSGPSWPSRRRGPIILNWPIPFPLPMPVPGGGRGGGGGGTGSSREEYERADAYLRELAQKTGARVYRPDRTRDLESTFALVAEELRRQYSLGYYPQTAAQAGQRRQIRVRVNRPNLAVRARDSYIFDPSANATAQSDQKQPSAPVLRKNHLAVAQANRRP